jgi:hypothetical protein
MVYTTSSGAFLGTCPCFAVGAFESADCCVSKPCYLLSYMAHATRKEHRDFPMCLFAACVTACTA